MLSCCFKTGHNCFLLYPYKLFSVFLPFSALDNTRFSHHHISHCTLCCGHFFSHNLRLLSLVVGHRVASLVQVLLQQIQTGTTITGPGKPGGNGYLQGRYPCWFYTEAFPIHYSPDVMRSAHCESWILPCAWFLVLCTCFWWIMGESSSNSIVMCKFVLLLWKLCLHVVSSWSVSFRYADCIMYLEVKMLNEYVFSKQNLKN